MTTKEEERIAAWGRVKEAVSNAKAMHFDGCHKIYLSMDDAQVEKMREYGYNIDEPDFSILRGWYEESCPLRLVSAVRTVKGDPNHGYDQIIPQFFEEDDDDESEDYS